ncbi:MAG TPA: DUF2254 domain-containing protein [Oligoflexus sp.]|uniref:DUF2254 domain-containing protein n=1 Tax=Oligoflexus sp. TaxID=1971216 RepID=UPI002D3B322A|nr:DUF2254 domain-containing protein [Oligoflexus sp.]HYX37101.1 DUF2254 domain-containing protein [Oligoflexus sp.]
MSKPLHLLFGKLRASYWFIPGIMAVAAASGAFVSLSLDHNLEALILPKWLLLFSGGPDAARDVLSAVAGSIITVAGVTFSISIVILSLASQQYGPRLLRNFMRDRSIHVAFGMFVATFVYSLLILPSPLSENELGREAFTPRLGVTVSIIMAIGCVFMLIYFIHHIARSIQASHIAAATCDELLQTIHALTNNEAAYAKEDARHAEVNARTMTSAFIAISSRHSGYVQACNIKQLVSLATQHDIVIEIKARPGGYIAHNDSIAHVSGKNSRLDMIVRDINDCFSLGSERTMEQDLEFGFQMLVEMAVRALSPSMNDPFTALQCIDYLREAFKAIMQVPVPKTVLRDLQGSIRVIQPCLSVNDLLTSTLLPLHHYARNAPMVLKGLNNMLASLEANAKSPAILSHMDNYRRQISESLNEVSAG